MDVTVVRDSIPRQVDKMSRAPEEEKELSGALEEETGVWNFQGERKDKLFFPPTLFSLSKDFITTVYPAWGQFLLENLLTNPAILKYILWEGAW